jgi:hypothetical protein
MGRHGGGRAEFYHHRMVDNHLSGLAIVLLAMGLACWPMGWAISRSARMTLLKVNNLTVMRGEISRWWITSR